MQVSAVTRLLADLRGGLTAGLRRFLAWFKRPAYSPALIVFLAIIAAGLITIPSWALRAALVGYWAVLYVTVLLLQRRRRARSGPNVPDPALWDHPATWTPAPCPPHCTARPGHAHFNAPVNVWKPS